MEVSAAMEQAQYGNRVINANLDENDVFTVFDNRVFKNGECMGSVDKFVSEMREHGFNEGWEQQYDLKLATQALLNYLKQYKIENCK